MKIYINKANGKYFIGLLFSNMTSKILDVTSSKKRAEEAVKYYAEIYKANIV